MKKSIGSDALNLTISKVITMGISMVNAMLLSRFRTLEEYGTYSQLLLIISVATTFFMMGLPNCINFFLARTDDQEERQKFLSVYYTFSTLLSVITGFVLVLSVPLFIKYFDNPLLNSYIYFLALFPWIKIVVSSIENVLIVYNKSKFLLIFRISHSIAILSIIIIVQIIGLTFPVYIFLYVIVETIFTIAVYMLVKNISGKIHMFLDKKILLNMLKFSIPIGFASVIGTLNIELDKLMIGRFFDTKQLAIYTNAAKELPVSIVSSALTAVLMPHLVRLLNKNADEKALNLWKSSVIISYIFIAVTSFGVFTYAPEVMTLLYSEKYLPGINVFRIYTIVLLLRVTYFGIILNAKGKTKFIFHSSVISLIINAILNFIFYKIFGFIGPAIASFVSIGIMQLLQLIVTSKMLKVSLKDVFPWIELMKITVVNIIFAIAFYFMKKVLPLDVIIGNVGESVVLGIIWVTIYMYKFYPLIRKNWNSLNNPD